jgi:hypothetical protein
MHENNGIKSEGQSGEASQKGMTELIGLLD